MTPTACLLLTLTAYAWAAVTTSDRGIYLDGDRYFIRGINYSPIPIGYTFGDALDVFNTSEIYSRDLPMIQALGANTIRIYGFDDPLDVSKYHGFLDMCNDLGIKVMINFWVPLNTNFSDAGEVSDLLNDFTTMVDRFSSHPAVFMWLVGNELSSYSTDYEDLFGFIYDCRSAALSYEGDNYHPVCAPIAETEDMFSLIQAYDSAVDVWCLQIYRGTSFYDLFSSFQTVSTKPLVLTEFGVSAANGSVVNPHYQALVDSLLMEEIFSNNDTAAGGLVFEYCDEWWRTGIPSIQQFDNSGNAYFGLYSVSEGDPNVLTARSAASALQMLYLTDDPFTPTAAPTIHPTLAPTRSPEASQSPSAVTVLERGIYLDGDRYFIRGINYSPIPIGYSFEDSLDVFNSSEIYSRDLPLIDAMGVNTIRIYGFADPLNYAKYEGFLDMCNDLNIKVMITFWVPLDTNFSDPMETTALVNDFTTMVDRFSDHPAVFMWLIGNELSCYATDLDELFSFVYDCKQAARAFEGDNYHPVCAPIAETTGMLSNVIYSYDYAVDVWCLQIYRGSSFYDLFSTYEALSSKPLVLTEFGVSAANGSDVNGQRQSLGDILLMGEIIANNETAAGGLIFEYSDEWWRAGNASAQEFDSNGDAYFGLYSISDGDPNVLAARPAVLALKALYLSDDPFNPTPSPTPHPTLAPTKSPAASQTPSVVTVQERGIYLDGERYFIKGINYSPIPIGDSFDDNTDVFATPEIYARDLPLIQAMGANTIRIYGFADALNFSQYEGFLDACNDLNIKVMITFWVPMDTNFTDAGEVIELVDDFITMVDRFASHPAVFMWLIGNELSSCTTDYAELFSFIYDCKQAARSFEGDNYHPVCAPLAETDDMFSLISAYDYAVDVWCLQIYRGSSFYDLFSTFETLSSKPLVLAEFGVSAANGSDVNGHRQSAADSVLMEEIIANNDTAAGGLVFEYCDEWWRAGNSSVQEFDSNGDAYFGLYSVSEGDPNVLTPRPAVLVLRSVYLSADPFPVTSSPSVSPTVSPTASPTPDLMNSSDSNNSTSPGGTSSPASAPVALGVTEAIVISASGVAVILLAGVSFLYVRKGRARSGSKAVALISGDELRDMS